jgi:hypothetical protein
MKASATLSMNQLVCTLRQPLAFTSPSNMPSKVERLFDEYSSGVDAVGDNTLIFEADAQARQRSCVRR